MFLGRCYLALSTTMMLLVISITANGYTWNYQVVDSLYPFQMGELVLDVDGRPHISYMLAQSNASRLKYAQLAQTWESQIVDSVANEGGDPSLAIDKTGKIHISYHELYPHDDLKYAYYDGSSWSISKIDSIGAVGIFTSIALDTSDLPTIAYLDATNQKLKIAARNPTGTWICTTLNEDDHYQYGHYPVILFGEDNNPNILYTRTGNGFDLRYTIKQGGWNRETIDNGAGGNDCGMVIDPNGITHVSYLYNGNDWENLNLNYAYRLNNEWYSEVVDTSGLTGFGSSIDLDSSGNPHISYSGNGNVYYAHKEQGVWRKQIIEQVYEGNQGWVPTSLALGGNDMVHIAYGIPSRELLRYVTSEDVKIDNDEYRRIISESKIESFQNYPNPANPVTTISFTLQAADPLLVKIRMYDIRGHLVKTVHDDLIQSGNYNLVWDGTNDKGASVPSGIYFCVLSTEGEERSIKLSLIH